MRRVTLAMYLLAACRSDGGVQADTGSSSAGMATSSGGTSSSGSTAAPDTGSDTGVGLETILDVTLELEITEDVRVVFTRGGDVLTAEVRPTRGYGLAADGASLSGPARIDALPEAGVDLYAATIAGPAVADGPCGAQPVSLALALVHDHDADVIAGGLTGYCGADRWFGVPVVEPLRISGRVP